MVSLPAPGRQETFSGGAPKNLKILMIFAALMAGLYLG